MARATIAGISPFFIVADVPATLAFYHDLLGFEVAFRGPSPEDEFFGIVRRDGAIIMVKALGAASEGTEVMVDLSPYKVGAHQHMPEIRQALAAAAGAPISLSFTPVLAPMPRGILATCTGRLAARASADAVRAAMTDAYADEPFVHVLPAGVWPHTAATLGSNSCHLAVDVDEDAGRVIVTSALDNLGKGAAGQGIQNANLILGLPETAGLPVNGVAP